MQVGDLETFALAVGEGSLTAAARRLFISQPAVSARLRRLEREVGEPLLLRSGRGVRPTAAGTRLYALTVPLLEHVRRLEQELRAGDRIRGRLAVGVTDLVAVHYLPGVFRKLRRDQPDLELNVSIEGTTALLRLLEEGRIELAVGTLPGPPTRVTALPLYLDPLVVIAAPGHPLVRRRQVRPEEVAGLPWISYKRESVTRRSVDAFFASHGLTPRTEMEISNPEAIKALVQARVGLAALPAVSVRRDLREGRLGTVPVRGFDLSRSSGLLLREGVPLSRAAQLFRTLLEAGARRRGQERRPG